MKCALFLLQESSLHTGKDTCEKLNMIKQVNLIQNMDTNNVLSTYKELFTGISYLLGCVRIELKHKTVLVIEACRKILFTMLNEVKAERDRKKKGGVIKRITQPTEWVSAMYIMHKLDEKLRIYLNSQNLNKAILHEHFKLTTREEIMVRMARVKIFSKLDCSKGFRKLWLDEESSRLCNFITPEGRYRY